MKMNDFTKDELEEILFFIEVHKNKYDLKYLEDIINKLQSLIDNYCEHEWQQSPRLEWLFQCMKCRKERCQRCAKEYE